MPAEPYDFIISRAFANLSDFVSVTEHLAGPDTRWLAMKAHVDDVERAISARDGRPLLIVDIAVPRDVDPAVGTLPDVTLLDINDLRRFAPDLVHLTTPDLLGWNALNWATRAAMLGARLFWRERKNTTYIFHGRQAELEPLLEEFPDLKPISRIAHSDVVITMDDKPSQALRKGRGAGSNREGRFELHSVEKVDDGWPLDEESLPAFETIVRPVQAGCDFR